MDTKTARNDGGARTRGVKFRGETRGKFTMSKKHTKQASGKDRNMAYKRRIAQKYSGIEARRNLENDREAAYYAGKISFDDAVSPRNNKRRKPLKCVIYTHDRRILTTRAVAYKHLHEDVYTMYIWDAKERVYVYYDAANQAEIKSPEKL